MTRAHTDGYSHTLLSEFTSLAANGDLVVGSEVMRSLGPFLRSRDPSLLYQEFGGGEERGLAIETFINTLLHHLQKAHGEHTAVRYSSKMLNILKELAP